MDNVKPTRKVSAGVLAGALTVIGLYLLKLSFSLEVPGPVASAITTLSTFVVSWCIPDKYEEL